MRKLLLFVILVLIINKINAQNIPNDSVYFGLTPPGDTPVKFATNFISGYVHGLIGISPKGNEIFWVSKPFEGSTERMYYSKYNKGTWTSPVIAPFIKDYASTNNGSPTFSPEGDRLYFYSDMTGGIGSYDAWYTKKTNEGWSQPINVGIPYNTENIDFSPLFTNTGNAYYLGYSSTYEAIGLCYKYVDSIFSEPTTFEIIPDYGPWLSWWFSAEGDYFIFAKGENADLYVRFKDSEGNWGTPISLGDKINSSQWERFPVISPDGKYLFFIRGNADIGNIYWVSTSIIKDLRNPSSATNHIDDCGLKIYPNPTSQVIKIEGLSGKNQKFQVVKIDGAIVKQGVLQTTKIDISDLTNGIYLLKLEFNERLITKQIIIH